VQGPFIKVYKIEQKVTLKNSWGDNGTKLKIDP